MNIRPETMQDYAREYLALKAQIEVLEARKTAIAAKFREELGDEAKEKFGKYTVTNFIQIRPSVKAKALKDEMPEVFAKYGTETVYAQTRVTTAKA